ncbi:4'-phosphopantetheinyl transferase [Micromonospora mangrovi]|uniref:4'-phosphopantetheinyl transferase superfamily protein n=2 Tax=Micromonospora TaxID=1873 RepID=A0AAU8HN69_9ACTN
MIGDLLPAPVVTAHAYGDPPEASLLSPEDTHITRAVERRRREFTTVRWCARTAMVALGVAPAPVLPGERGAPCWPAGVVGSMTHCAGYRAAALAPAATVRTVGIDAEPNERLPAGVLAAIALPAERARLGALFVARPDVAADRLLWSAKEAFYKAWFPLGRRLLDFDEAEVELRADGTFSARLRTPEPGVPDGFPGRWRVADGLVATAIAVPVAESAG